MIIPIGVTAKNEAQNLPKLLESLRASIKCAHEKLSTEFEIHVLLNDNSDHSEQILSTEADVHIWHTFGGLVEAQRFFRELKADSLFLIFCDADIVLDQNCIYELVSSLLEKSELQVTYAEKIPLKPKKSTVLSRALYIYNLNNGYQTHRHYFNGQLFAIRNWYIPKVNELKWDEELDNHFLNLKAGIRCDDIYLSRYALLNYGPESIFCTSAAIRYRPPETLQGMYRKFQRMCLEIERLNCYFPETLAVHKTWGQRKLQRKTILSKPALEIFYYAVFLLSLYLCKTFYQFEKFYFSHLSSTDCPTWKPVLETKDLS